jgi:hypothetical protein
MSPIQKFTTTMRENGRGKDRSTKEYSAYLLESFQRPSKILLLISASSSLKRPHTLLLTSPLVHDDFSSSNQQSWKNAR